MRIKTISMILTVLMLFAGAYAQQKFYKQIAQLPGPRQMYGAVVSGDYLYIIGGNNQGVGEDPSGYIKDVHMAKINADGTIGAWQQTTPLPQNRSYIHNSTIALDDIIYVVAGFDGQGNKKTNTILWSKPAANGQLEPWKESVPFPGSGISCSAAVATPGYIHLICGTTQDDQVSSIIWSAKTGSDGSIISWESSNFPSPLWFHCAGVARGQVWVWGGLTSPKNVEASPMVYRAPILSNGKIGQWIASPAVLPEPFYSASSTVSGAYLLSFCPKYSGGKVSNDIYYADLNSVDAKGGFQWKKLTTDIQTRIYISVATDYRRGFVYIPGGRIDSTESDQSLDRNVYFFALNTKQQSDNTAESTVTIRNDAGSQSGANLAYLSKSSSVPGKFPGFISYNQAKEKALAEKKPMIVYLYSTRARKCAEQAQILQGFNTQAYGGSILFAEMESLDNPQFTQQYGIFKIPCWLLFNKNGVEVYRHIGVLQAADIDTMAKKLLQ